VPVDFAGLDGSTRGRGQAPVKRDETSKRDVEFRRWNVLRSLESADKWKRIPLGSPSAQRVDEAPVGAARDSAVPAPIAFGIAPASQIRRPPGSVVTRRRPS